MGLVDSISCNSFDSICGGRHALYALKIHKFFNKLKDSGAELVFFTDGPIRVEKYPTWIKRLNNRYKISMHIIEDVDNGLELSRIFRRNAAKMPRVTSIYDLIEDIARQHGELTIATDAECDTEIAEYASNNPAVLAVLAEDSDFLIFSGKWRYFSLRHINQITLITYEYNRDALRLQLKLNDKELVCLSVIIENNLFESNNNFFPIDETYFNIAECVKLLNLSTFNFNEDQIIKMLDSIATPETKMKIKNSFAFYNTNFIKTDLSIVKPLIHKCLQHKMRFVYNVLSGQPVNFTLYYYDLSKEPISYYNLVIPLFKRKIGILYNYRCHSTIKYYVYSKLTHLHSYEKLTVNPIFPTQNVPPLEELLFGEDDNALDQVRFNLLKEIIGTSMDVDLKAIPKNYLVDVLVLEFLVLNHVISILEADIILISITKVELGEFEEEIDYPSTLDKRAFRVSLLFAKIYSNINGAVEVVGLLKLKVRLVSFNHFLVTNLFYSTEKHKL